MILYHGSNVEVRQPDIAFPRSNVDFGKGFYTTALREQAERWCQRFKRQGAMGVLSVYELDESALSTLAVKRFDSYSEEWLDFVLACRNGDDATDYDVVEGALPTTSVQHGGALL